MDRGLLHAVLLVVIGVWHGSVQLDHGLAFHGTGVLHGDRGDGGFLVALDLDAVKLLFERRVAQAVAERIHHFVGVIPCAIRSRDRAVGSGIGSGRSRITAIAHDDVGVTGFVVAVTGVDAFGLHQIGVDGRIFGKVGGVLPGHVAIVAHGRRDGTVLGHHVTQVG